MVVMARNKSSRISTCLKRDPDNVPPRCEGSSVGCGLTLCIALKSYMQFLVGLPDS
jgi:hypothetical protein